MPSDTMRGAELLNLPVLCSVVGGNIHPGLPALTLTLGGYHLLQVRGYWIGCGFAMCRGRSLLFVFEGWYPWRSDRQSRAPVGMQKLTLENYFCCLRTSIVPATNRENNGWCKSEKKLITEKYFLLGGSVPIFMHSIAQEIIYTNYTAM